MFYEQVSSFTEDISCVPNSTHEPTRTSQAASLEFRNELPKDAPISLTETEIDPDLNDATDALTIVENGAQRSRPLGRQLGSSKRCKELDRCFRLHDPESDDPPARGWRKAVLVATALTGIILLVNVALTIVANTRYSTAEGNSNNGVRLIYSGRCILVERWNTALHLLINLLGTLLLAASSFTMQCLTSPTRSELDVAHGRGVSFTIGVPSLNNLLRVRRWKASVWLLLCLSTIPLHMFWNSAVFITSPQSSFSAVVASQNFLQGNTHSQLDGLTQFMDNTTLSKITTSLYEGYRSGNYTTLNATACLDTYTTDLHDVRRNLIVLVQHPTPSNQTINSGCASITPKIPWNGSAVVAACEDIDVAEFTSWITVKSGCLENEDIHRLRQEARSTGNWSFQGYRVESCESETNLTPLPCELQFLPSILYIVVAFNAIKFVCMCITAHFLWNQDEPILATVGDAVASFLDHSDKTTRGICLMDHRNRQRGTSEYDPTYNRRSRRRIYFATTHLRWWTTMQICTIYLAAGWMFYYLSISEPLTGSIWSKFGTVVSDRVISTDWAERVGLLVCIMIVNSFQTMLSITYFLYNSLYTAQCAALEWATYSQCNRKALRVTYPSGQQRSSYYLHLPYRYGIPLTVLLMLMHFLVSQSVFLALPRQYDWQGNTWDQESVSEVGFSPPAIFTTCIIGVVLVLAQVIHAFRPLENRMPIHCNDSVIISAACHPERHDENELRSQDLFSIAADMPSIATRPIMWGVTRYPDSPVNDGFEDSSLLGDGAGHCGFSADVVDMPEIGKKYR